jgi:hypothetical protein
VGGSGGKVRSLNPIANYAAEMRHFVLFWGFFRSSGEI